MNHLRITQKTKKAISELAATHVNNDDRMAVLVKKLDKALEREKTDETH